ncbi:undecaprenyl phosphate-alpha-4-amino-4-deoxy-L-arabinose arabinosyl transferase [Clostridium ragsdalei P11]|uniref:Undecaprenyl phosphate-alpha-4-amino-4-deoxy-L-arabinose arabinosyl transferase n=1 Tax=Clostridium ragsdalei P11 TaxID=1353534 RepID=A0A1A6AIC9_9CLOT|nr:glycosyltransferase family 39 protein [Clostridium ragsdalei]OBR89806.1 undecaprenyl phosphate-alpha-4-amino-4-deoxy-L-arabinose arabinosyl transferase [Clostridium ragsdalei P11]
MKKFKFTKERFALCIILAISAILNFANLTIEGYGNGYYAAGVKSMLMNFKNFFFVSFDPAGFVSIDKPPLGFWIQTISAKIFGFSGWSILFPEALAGVISVGILYYIVKRSFGEIAGLISALCLAITPVFVATSRNNTIDNLLIVTLLFACLFLSKAAEKGKLKYLIISLVLVGLGFNIKMLQAYMIAPALYITYLISSAVPVKQRIKHLIISTLILGVISLSWAVAVDLVPSQNRPFVGSSTNNTVTELIFGHNGLERLSSTNGGMGGGPSGKVGNPQSKEFRSNFGKNQANSQSGNSNAPSGMTPPQNSGNSAQGQQGGPGGETTQGNSKNQGGGPGGGGPGGSNGLSGSFGGQTTAGVTRLFSKNVLSDQIVWFLPLAIFGLATSVIVEKLKFPFDNKKKLGLTLWTLWLVPEFIYFSYTKGLFHPYYLTMLAPPIAALCGIGLTSMWKLYKEGSIKSWIMPAAFIAEGLVHLLMLSYFTTTISTTIKCIIIAAIILCFASAALLIIYRIVKKGNLDQGNSGRLAKIFTALALIGILVTPAIGSAAAITHSLSSLPAAGLELLSNSKSGNSMMMGGQNSSKNSKLIKFLENHTSNEKYALVVSSSASAEDIIIESGKSVMALGGFSGSDKILSLDQFKQMVKKGEVRYVLTGGMGGRDSQDIMNWIQKNGKAVSTTEWKDTTSSQAQKSVNSNNNNKKENSSKENSSFQHQGMDGMNNETLYDLKGTVK